ncbi:hypothetical protein JOF35_008848 [Streptomyces demainii]|uniref:Uncharacterized protein n=1 Tax=Streptomyces demainii TaxID=588122 RepID=A0ABT9L864_9ACTN|nr:hypothetical protein [Streptomyces demainii]
MEFEVPGKNLGVRLSGEQAAGDRAVREPDHGQVCGGVESVLLATNS